MILENSNNGMISFKSSRGWFPKYKIKLKEPLHRFHPHLSALFIEDLILFSLSLLQVTLFLLLQATPNRLIMQYIHYPPH